MDKGVKHLLEASVRLKCNMETTSKALILYHQFMQSINDVKYDDSMVAAAALGLSGKINEQLLDQDSILLSFFCIANNTSRVLKVEDPEFPLLKKSLITLDYVMQRMLNFDLNPKLAHQYLAPYLNVIFSRSWKVAQFRGEISHTCIRLICDFYMHKVCLKYQADHITIACIDASLNIYGLVNEMEMIQPWYKGFSKDLDEVKIIEIQDTMFSLYEVFANKCSLKDFPAVASTSHKEMDAVYYQASVDS